MSSLNTLEKKEDINGLKKSLKFLNNNTQFKEEYFPKRPALDVTFKNVRYSVKTWNKLRPVKKEILHGVSGEFRSGELTAIMGPSGAGKSTLLNILAGYIQTGSQGTVLVNGEDRRIPGIQHFLKLSCYIQQDDALRPLLTVQESMIMAAHMKLGLKVPMYKKLEQVQELLDMLGLAKHCNTVTKRLSGGQQKRLSIALELITNPPIIFLDEPTTGLDSLSCSQCVQLLKNLAAQGRTVVCTIHQPSALVFEKFDHLYAVAAGRCIYQGPVNALVPYFSQFDLNCPPYHNPADFLIEVAIGEYEADKDKLTAAASCLGRNTFTSAIIGQPGYKYRKQNPALSSDEIVEYTKSLPKSPPFVLQAFYLFSRNITSIRRNKLFYLIRILAHLFIAVIFGYLYEGVGNNASRALANGIFLYGSNLFLIYTGQMAVILSFPLEFEMLKREHFNRWYSLLPYLVSTLLIEIPLQVACSTTYLLPAYFLTGQPMELFRLAYFAIILIVTSLTAQSTGFLLGATLPVNISVFIGPVLMVLFSVFGFAIRLADIPATFKWLHYFSFVRSSYHSLLYSMYGMKRSLLPCDQTYCHFRYAGQFLVEMDVKDFEMYTEFFYICFICVLVYISTSFCIWYRLNKR
ncbi:ATP-binding cassette sub-family G member 1 [Planococcus citri]|uniref:ATP-binding cassette sub-family G member 1 n=1 Tax=Planococcus citri TaxID=170843 RepID=UPI0031F9A881